MNVLVIGGSAGSLEIIMRMLPGLKEQGLPAIILVIHRKAGDDDSLTDLLASKSRIRVKEAEEKERITGDMLYIAPADYHLLIENDGTFSLDDSEKVNYSRPSIDVTFQAAAEIYGSGLAAILLSGASEDGAAGLKKIKEAGGTIAVQDPASAEVPYMPARALQRVGGKVTLVDERTLADFINNL